MGTINYATSDYITIGYNCNAIDYDDEYFFDDFIEPEYETIKQLLNQHYFYYFHVTVEPGYYEGFYINIEYNFPLFFDDYSERREAQKEVTTLKYVLTEILKKTSCCAVHPGWCMVYLNQSESLQELNEAVKEMRSEVNSTPTYKQYQKAS